jgi:hypothetical protein
MRGTQWLPFFAVCACFCSCGEPKLECATGDVTSTLTSMVRDRVLHVAADAYPPSYDAAMRARLARSTRVIPRDMRLLEWDAVRGNLQCVASVVIDAPGPQAGTNQRRVAELRYRVMRDVDDVFLVEIGYADLMRLFP